MFRWAFWSLSCRSSRSSNLMTLLFCLFYLKKVAFRPGWQKLAAFRRGHNWPKKNQASAYFLFSRQMRRFACQFANLIQYGIQYALCNSALLVQDTLFLTTKSIFLPKFFQKVHKFRKIFISQQNSVCQGLLWSTKSEQMADMFSSKVQVTPPKVQVIPPILRRRGSIEGLKNNAKYFAAEL